MLHYIGTNKWISSRIGHSGRDRVCVCDSDLPATQDKLADTVGNMEVVVVAVVYVAVGR